MTSQPERHLHWASDALNVSIPDDFCALFWDCDPGALQGPLHRNFVIRRFLDRGNLQAISWLRSALGDRALRDWFLAKKGRGLSAARIRFWALVLDLPTEAVDAWVDQARQSTWHRRTRRWDSTQRS